MDISLFRKRTHEFKNLLTTISALQKNSANPKTNPEILKISKGLALLFIAIALAWISKSETENSTRERVLQTEWPPTQILHAVLTQGGWTSSKTDLSTTLKNHPDPFSSESMLWESEDHCLIFLTQSPEPELWSCATSHNRDLRKIKWHKLGSGYAGINTLAKIVVPKIKIPTSYIDPKEIRY